MKKFFINYLDLMKDNKINKYYDIYSEDIYIMSKNNKGIYNFVPILYFSDYDKNLYAFSEKIKNYKDKELVVELKEKDVKLFDSSSIIEVETVDGKNYRLPFEKNNNIIKLINYSLVTEYKVSDLNNGKLNVVVMTPINGSEYRYVSTGKSIITINSGIKERRTMLNHSGINCDLYFQTEDESFLNRYKENIVELEEIDYNKYKILHQKLFVVDSISADRLYNLSKNNYTCLDGFMTDSVPISITEEDDKYKLELLKDYFYRGKGKGYIINYDILLKYIYNSGFEPFIKYFNVYEYEEGLYNKQSLKSYLERNDILKYIKKPNK